MHFVHIFVMQFFSSSFLPFPVGNDSTYTGNGIQALLKLLTNIWN